LSGNEFLALEIEWAQSAAGGPIDGALSAAYD